MRGWHLRMTWGQEVFFASQHSEPASALGLPTVWSLWGTQEWIGVKRCQLCLQDSSRIAKCFRQAAVGHWFHCVCVWSVVGWLIVYQDGNYLYPRQYSQNICWSQIWGGNILMARPSTFLESRTWWGHDYGKVIYLITNVPNYRLAKNLLS